MKLFGVGRTFIMCVLFCVYMTACVILLHSFSWKNITSVSGMQYKTNIDIRLKTQTERKEIRKPPVKGDMGGKQVNAQVINVNNTTGKKYFLTEILMVRIHEKDKARWTVAELKQWLHYMIYMGVEHVYLCDHFVLDTERLNTKLKKYITSGLVTYIPWPWQASDNAGVITEHQVQCYRQTIRRYGGLSEWQISVDMDEYPFCPGDYKSGFFTRYIKKATLKPGYKTVTQILMPNFLMLGQGDRARNITIDRINRITPKEANRLHKPLYKPNSVQRADIHRHIMTEGSETMANNSELRMLHYWGSRVQNWGPDTKATLDKTEEYNLMRDNLVLPVRLALLASGENEAFSNTTGP